MNFDFTPEQEMLRQTVRKFVDKEILPHIKEWDERGYFDPNILKRLAQLNLMGVCIPEQY
ncbi:MAG: acyl-CoA dehydrogenase family protein, partial [Anoxybacillus ayderensis]|nr:acyl-CoA dehydrogenase family protein [Anoxybacillus ayderensis]